MPNETSPEKCKENGVTYHISEEIKRPRDLAPFRISLLADHRNDLKIKPYRIGIALYRKVPRQTSERKANMA